MAGREGCERTPTRTEIRDLPMGRVIERLEIAAPCQSQLIGFAQRRVHTLKNTLAEDMEKIPFIASHFPMKDPVHNVHGFTDIVRREGIGGLGMAQLIKPILFGFIPQGGMDIKRDAPLAPSLNETGRPIG